MTPTNTALLLIEYQNDFVSEGGAQHDAVKTVMQEVGTLPNSQKVLEGARDKGLTILHAGIAFAEGYPEIPEVDYGILAGVKHSGAFKRGHWGSEFSTTMAPRADDIVIDGKRGLDCFASTNLDFILRARGIETLVLAGFLTNCCVESTMRSAYERSFNVITLTDCTATLSMDEQRLATQKNFAMFSRPMTHKTFLDTL